MVVWNNWGASSVDGLLFAIFVVHLKERKVTETTETTHTIWCMDWSNDWSNSWSNSWSNHVTGWSGTALRIEFLEVSGIALHVRVHHIFVVEVGKHFLFVFN